MFYFLLCAAISEAAVDQPASAVDAVDSALLARLPSYFVEQGQGDPSVIALFAMPVAKINGRVIFAGTILRPLDDYMQELQSQNTPEKYAEILQGVIRSELPETIVSQVVLLEAEARFDRQDAVWQELEAEWLREKVQIARQLTSRKGRFPIRYSLDDLRERFFQRKLIQHYLIQRFGEQPEEMREYFRQIPLSAEVETLYSFAWPE